MKAIFFSLVTAFFTLPTLSWSASIPSTIVIAGVDHPPLINARGEGMLSDLYQATFKAVGLDTQMEVLPKRRMEISFRNREVQAIVEVYRGDQLDVERDPLFSAVLNLMPCWFFLTNSIEDPDHINGLNDLSGYRIGTGISSPYADLYQRHNLNTVQIDTPEQLVAMLHRKRIDFMEAYLLSGLYLLHQELPNNTHEFEYMQWTTLEIGLRFHNPALKQRFDEGLAQIKQSGSYRKILESYWGKDNIPQANFLDMYPVQGVYFPNLEQFWSAPRDPTGRILSR